MLDIHRVVPAVIVVLVVDLQCALAIPRCFHVVVVANVLCLCYFDEIILIEDLGGGGMLSVVNAILSTENSLDRVCIFLLKLFLVQLRLLCFAIRC